MSVHRGGGCLPQCMLGCQTTPPRPGRHPPDQADSPQTRQTPPPLDQADTYPPDQADPPPWTRQTPPDQVDPPRAGKHPPDQVDTPPGSRLQHTVYERPIRILLECILVISAFERKYGRCVDCQHRSDCLTSTCY